jgi:hypothetical protein
MFLRIARVLPANGILFAVLVVVATLFTNGSPDTDSSDATWTSYYADAGNRHGEEISLFLIGLAGLCFLQFLGTVRGALARAEGEPSRITTAAVASGAAFITLAVSAHAVGTANSWAVSASDNFTVDPNTARLFSTLSYVLFVLSLMRPRAWRSPSRRSRSSSGFSPRGSHGSARSRPSPGCSGSSSSRRSSCSPGSPPSARGCWCMRTGPRPRRLRRPRNRYEDEAGTAPSVVRSVRSICRVS